MRKRFDILVSDIYLGDDSGLHLLERMKTINSDAEVVIMTAHGSMETAVHAVHNGAFDYISKPFVIDEMLGILRRIEEKFRLVEGVTIGAELVDTLPNTEMIGATPKMVEHLQEGCQDRADRSAGSCRRRERFRQRTRRSCRARQQRTRDRSFHRHQLRRLAGNIAGKRTLWSRAGLVYRSNRRAQGPAGERVGRNCVSR